VLALGVSAGTASLLAGCATLNGKPTTRFSNGLTIDNLSQNAVSVRVEVTDSDATLYNATHEVEAAVYESEDGEERLRQAGEYHVELGDWQDESAYYSVRATLPDGTTEEYRVARGETCVTPHIRIDPSSELSISNNTCADSTEQ
jgi:hypothetical protein